MSDKVEAYRLKNIIPFVYDTFSEFAERKNDSFEILNRKIELLSNIKKPKWRASSADLKAEQDIYQYVLNSLDGSVAPDQSKIASIWKYNVGNGRRLRFIQRNNSLNRTLDFTITEMELFLFENHIGLLCFEVSFLHKDFTIDDLISFQNSIKDFAYLQKSTRVLEKVFKITTFEKEIKDCYDENYIEVIDSCNHNKWINKSIIKDERILGIADSRRYLDIETKSIQNNRVIITIYDDFNIGIWLTQILDDLVEGTGVKYDFLTKRIITSSKKSYIIPDKAILYTYALVRNDNESHIDNCKKVFWLSNGFKDTYNIPVLLEKETFEPFGGSVWYSSRQGCGCLVRYDSHNKAFYRDVFQSKVINDYFYIYIILLNQTLGLTYFSKKINELLPAHTRNYMIPNPSLLELLSYVNTDINVFLMKCTSTSISSLKHQNDFYQYTKRQMDINDDIITLQNGLNRLNRLQETLLLNEDAEREKNVHSNREKIDRSLNLSLAILSLFAVISAIADAKVIFWDSDPVASLYHISEHPFFIIALIVICLITIIVVYRIIIIINDMLHSTHQKRGLTNDRDS